MNSCKRIGRSLTGALLLVLAGVALRSAAAEVAVEPRGPIDNGMKVTADADGIQAPGYRFTNTCTKPAPWQAQWIWPQGPAANAPTACFRKEITLDAAPQQVAAWMTADAKYRLFINGHLVVRGPVDQGNDFAGGLTRRWFYDYRDLTPFFQKGKNVISAEVFRHWPAGPTISRGHPGLLFEADLTLPGGTKVKAKSDASWRATAAAYFASANSMDLGKEPTGWRLPDFDDKAWSACVVQADVWSPIIPSEMPPLMEGRYPVLRIEGLPESKTFTKDGQFRVIFDRVLSAYPTLKIKGGKGATVKIHAHHEVNATLGDGEQYIEFPFMTEVVPSYTVELKNVTAPIEILDAGAVFTSQPLEYRGAFECSDEKLNNIWKVSRWAVQICLQTHHLDSPNHQEPISDPGDYLIESMVNHYAFAQPWLARQDVRKFAWLLKDENYHNFHTSYSIGWLQMLMDYYDYTGDKTLLDEMAPYVHELMDTYASWRGANGILCEAPNYMFMDWVKIGGFEVHHPPAVIGQGYLTAFYYHGMAMASRIATLTGDGARVEKYAKLRQEIATAFNRELWVDGKGLYRDGKPFQTHVKPGHWLPADKDIETFSPHVNLLSVLYDLAPKDKQSAIVEKVLAENPLNTQPWFMHWVFQAIDHAGLFDQYATTQMRRWSIVKETQSFHEMWNGGDLSHGWCSTPLVQMSQRVLGVAPSAPGFKTIAIAPQTCDLTFAKGRVPTPQGDVSVSWAFGENTFTLDVTTPSPATITVPTARFANPALTQDGQACQATVQVAAGTYHFAVTGTLKPLATPATVNKPRPGTWPQTDGDSCAAFEADVIAADLIHAGPACALAKVEDHASHAGGGTATTALYNGTTKNGSDSDGTQDDGKTFRGYGTGDSITFFLDTAKSPKGYDISEIRVFAGHPDNRASQNYSVLVALAGEPSKFVQVGVTSVQCGGGSSETRVLPKASGVLVVRLEFKNGSTEGGAGEGFNVYREINIVGKPTTAP